MKKIKVLFQKVTTLLSIFLTIYFIACYVDVISNNTSKGKAEELTQHNYNIIVEAVR